jgi:hypothetical protein
VFYALLSLALINVLYHAYEITFPHRTQELYALLQSDPEAVQMRGVALAYTLLPLMQIPFVLLLFSTTVSRFTFYGYLLIGMYLFELILVRRIVSHREAIAAVALGHLFINVDVVRSVFLSL